MAEVGFDTRNSKAVVAAMKQLREKVHQLESSRDEQKSALLRARADAEHARREGLDRQLRTREELARKEKALLQEKAALADERGQLQDLLADKKRNLARVENESKIQEAELHDLHGQLEMLNSDTKTLDEQVTALYDELTARGNSLRDQQQRVVNEHGGTRKRLDVTLQEISMLQQSISAEKSIRTSLVEDRESNEQAMKRLLLLNEDLMTKLSHAQDRASAKPHVLYQELPPDFSPKPKKRKKGTKKKAKSGIEGRPIFK